jgi:peptide/nickel transport system substrate-binding protein
MTTLPFSRRAFLAAAGASFAFAAARRPASAHDDGTPLRVAFGKDRYQFDDSKFTFTLRGPAADIVETVVMPGDDYFPLPNLFVSWTVTEDGLYTAEIRPDVRFHDGMPLDAEAIAKSLLLVNQGFIGLDPESIRVTGPMTVEFRSTTGSLLMMENMAHRMASIFDTASDRATHPVGTGP